MQPATQLADLTNQANAGLSLNRLEAFSPGLGGSFSNLGAVTRDLTAGRLPFEDVLDIVSDRQELSGALGTPGGSTNATLADLGLSRLDAITQGSNMFNSLVNTANSLAPQSNAGDFFLSTQQRLSAEQTQRAREQAAAQSAAFINASPDPAAAGLFDADTAAALATVNGALGNASSFGNNLAPLGSAVGTAAQIYGNQQNTNALINAYSQNRNQTQGTREAYSSTR